MISYITGTLEYQSDNSIVVECGGIGYSMMVSGQFMNRLPAMHSHIKVFTYMSVREDEISLYGFYDRDELEVFKVLLSVNGVGPKAAMSILSALTVNELRLAVVSEDVKSITRANGIGTKGASRIILELKDKLRLEDMIDAAYEDAMNGSQAGSGGVAQSDIDTRTNVVAALTALGYSGVEAGRAVNRVEGWQDMDEEQLLKASLKNII